MTLSLRGRRLNGLPGLTLICIVIALNLARHREGIYIEEGLGSLARDLSRAEWGGCWWYPLGFQAPGPSKPMVPEGAWLS